MAFRYGGALAYLCNDKYRLKIRLIPWGVSECRCGLASGDVKRVLHHLIMITPVWCSVHFQPGLSAPWFTGRMVRRVERVYQDVGVSGKNSTLVKFIPRD